MEKKSVFVVVTCIKNNDEYDEFQCCNCNHLFDHKPAIGEECPGCKIKVGQIEVL